MDSCQTKLHDFHRKILDQVVDQVQAVLELAGCCSPGACCNQQAAGKPKQLNIRLKPREEAASTRLLCSPRGLGATAMSGEARHGPSCGDARQGPSRAHAAKTAQHLPSYVCTPLDYRIRLPYGTVFTFGSIRYDLPIRVSL